MGSPINASGKDLNVQDSRNVVDLIATLDSGNNLIELVDPNCRSNYIYWAEELLNEAQGVNQENIGPIGSQEHQNRRSMDKLNGPNAIMQPIPEGSVERSVQKININQLAEKEKGVGSLSDKT